MVVTVLVSIWESQDQVQQITVTCKEWPVSQEQGVTGTGLSEVEKSKEGK